MVKELPGVHIIVDDILVAGLTVEEHDGRLRATLATARKNGIKFNPKKIQRCSTEVKFFGEMLTKDGLKPDQVLRRAGKSSNVSWVCLRICLSTHLIFHRGLPV